MPETMTLQQLAEYLQISPDSLYHAIHKQKIPGIKIGKQWRFSRKAIDQWLAGPIKHEISQSMQQSEHPQVH